jgi:hypothetical protein
LEKRVHFVEDLLGTTCERLMLNNLPMEHVVVHHRGTEATEGDLCFRLSGDTDRRKYPSGNP